MRWEGRGSAGGFFIFSVYKDETGVFFSSCSTFLLYPLWIRLDNLLLVFRSLFTRWLWFLLFFCVVFHHLTVETVETVEKKSSCLEMWLFLPTSFALGRKECHLRLVFLAGDHILYCIVFFITSDVWWDDIKIVDGCVRWAILFNWSKEWKSVESTCPSEQTGERLTTEVCSVCCESVVVDVTETPTRLPKGKVVRAKKQPFLIDVGGWSLNYSSSCNVVVVLFGQEREVVLVVMVSFSNRRTSPRRKILSPVFTLSRRARKMDWKTKITVKGESKSLK